MQELAPDGYAADVISSGEEGDEGNAWSVAPRKAEGFGEINSSSGYPDVRSFRRKFGLVIPATNTSMEHELWGVEEIKAPVADIEAYSGLSWATWYDAIQAALRKYRAKRIGILTPFDKKGNESAGRARPHH